MRKFLRLMMALVLTLGLCVPAYAAEAEASFVVVQPGQPPKAGETFTVTVELTGGMDFSAVQFTLNYNREEMTCTDISTGDLLVKMMYAVNPDTTGEATIAAASGSSIRASGTLATLTFTARTDVTDFDFSLVGVELATATGVILPYRVTGAATPANSGTQAPANQSQGGSQTSGGQTQPGGEQGRPGEEPDNPREDPANDPVGETFNPIGETATLFTDTSGSWAADYIRQAAARGLIQGYNGLYRPDDSMTRAELVTILWRANGSPADGGASFTDLTQGWYLDAVAWAERNGVVNGVGDGRFDPNGHVTREQLATILHRMAGSPVGMETMVSGMYDLQFVDSANVSGWAKPSLYWSVFNEIYCGEADLSVGQMLVPKADASRAQIAVMIVRYLDRN